jgi:hypothetical protein
VRLSGFIELPEDLLRPPLFFIGNINKNSEMLIFVHPVHGVNAPRLAFC